MGVVGPGTPAARAGIQVNDTITAVDSVPVSQFFEAAALIRDHAGIPIRLGLAGPGGTRTLSLTPDVASVDTAGRKFGRIGIGVAEGPTTHSEFDLRGAIGAGTDRTLESSGELLRVIRGMLTRKVSTDNLGGPILIGQMAKRTFDLGWEYFIGFLALISVNLAVLNLLPIPILDGGQAVFLLYEGLFRKPMPLRAREALMMLGLVLIVALMVVANWNDIRRTFFGG